MWVDPEDDPREKDVSATGEKGVLEEYLDHYRLTLAMKCEGLDAEQMARRFGASLDAVVAGPGPAPGESRALVVSSGAGRAAGHGRSVEVRDIVVHMIEEYARHLGHADLLRECIDGRTGQ